MSVLWVVYSINGFGGCDGLILRSILMLFKGLLIGVYWVDLVGTFGGYFCAKVVLGGQMGGQMGGQNSEKKCLSLPTKYTKMRWVDPHNTKKVHEFLKFLPSWNPFK